MANPNPIFRKEALDHLDDAPRTAHRVVLIRPVDRLALVALATVVILATLWSAFGSVSVRVEGDGILLRPRRLADVGADGQLVSSAVLATLSEPALVQQRNQLRARFEALRARDDAADVAAAHQLALQQDSLNRQLAEFDARIAQLEGMVRDHNAARRAVSALRREGLRAQESLLDAQAVAARTRLATSEGLVARGVAAANDLAAARAEVLAATQALAAVREALKSEPLEDLEAALAHDDLLTRLADARANRDAASTRLVSLQREEDLRRSTAAADQALLADQLAAVSLALDRQRAAPEPAEAEAAAPPAEDPLLVAVFMDAAAAKRVSPGMEILVSPGSVERARFGSARGEVTEVSESPVTTALAGALLDNPALADTLVANGSVVLLIARLTPDPSTDSGFQWTTASGPPGRLTPGTPVTAQVIVERRRPITWLLPALRNATGTGG
jgi:HlyD family secretion protein